MAKTAEALRKGLLLLGNLLLGNGLLNRLLNGGLLRGFLDDFLGRFLGRHGNPYKRGLSYDARIILRI